MVPRWLSFTIITGISAFLRRAWSVNETFFLAVVIGFISPVLNALLFRWLPWQSVPFVFFPLLAVFVALLYWRVERGHFRTDWRAMLETSGAGLLWAAGAIGSGWCYNNHVCIDGHMAHPPYPFWHYTLDVGWALAVLVAAFLMRLVRSSLCVLFATLAAYLVSYRFLFGSLGGMYEWLPL
jgi:hypothetical protein